MTAKEKIGRSKSEWDEIVTECVTVLEETASRRDLISYSDLASRITTSLGMSPPIDHHRELSHILYNAGLTGFERTCVNLGRVTSRS